MMTDQQYNEFFRNRMEDFSSPVPDHIWNTVASNNKKSKSKWLTPTKFILLLFCLIIGLKTSDKLMNFDGYQNAASLYKLNNKRGHIHSIAETYTTDKKENSGMSVTKKNVTRDFSATKQIADKQQLRDLHEKKQSGKNNTISEEIIGSNLLTTLAFTEQTDNTTTHTTEAKKKLSEQNHPDSAAGTTVETHKNKDRLSLYVFASPDAIFSHVSSGNNSYQQQRNREASPQFSWSAGVRVRYNINAHWSGNIGFQHSFINEKITLTSITSQNRYTSFDVPVIAGYRIYKNRFEIDANAGIIFNISTAYKGYISSVNNDPVNIHKENIYKSNTSLSYYGGVQFLYHPANRISLFAEPYFNYQPQNIANSFQPFEERTQRAGILLGARYRFDK